MDLKKIIRKRSDLLKLSLNTTYYRSDNSKDFSTSSVRVDLKKVKLKQFKHDPSIIMTYLPGIFATPTLEYAEKYPQGKLFKFDFTGKIFEIPFDLKLLKKFMSMEQFLVWLKDNSYDAAYAANAAKTNFGNFDEIVILNKAKIKNITEVL